MDKWTFYLYLWTRLDVINDTFEILLMISIGMLLWCLYHAFLYSEGCTTEYDEEVHQIYKKKIWKFALPTIIIWVIVAAIPTQRDISIIYYVPKIANFQAAKEASQIPADALKWLRLTLEQKINEATIKEGGNK